MTRTLQNYTNEGIQPEIQATKIEPCVMAAHQFFISVNNEPEKELLPPYPPDKVFKTKDQYQQWKDNLDPVTQQYNNMIPSQPQNDTINET